MQCGLWVSRNDDALISMMVSNVQELIIFSRFSFKPSPSPSDLPTAPPSNVPVYAYVTSDIELLLLGYPFELTEDKIEEFETITLPFLRKWVNRNFIHLKSFEVTSQEFVENRRNLRGLTDSALKLTIKATVQLLSVKHPISSIQLKDEIVSALETETFTKLLQETTSFGDTTIYFDNASALVDTDEVPLEDIPEQKPRKGTNAKTVIISVILSIVLVTVGILYRMDRLPRLQLKRRKRDMLRGQYNESSSYVDEESANSKVADKMNGVCISRILSKNFSDESPLDLNFKYCDDENNTERNLPKMMSAEKKNLDDENLTSLFAKTPQAAQVSHIPPMIVFDNIDNEELSPAKHGANDALSSVGASELQLHTQDSIFVRRVQATSDLVAVLSAKKTPNPIEAYNFLK